MWKNFKKALKVSIIGEPNAGKSTLLNKLVGYEISAVSNKVHTTTKNILGVLTQDHVQIEFLDSPGLVTKNHAKKHRLGLETFKDPEGASKEADLIAVVYDAKSLPEHKSKLSRQTLDLLDTYSDKKSILILNKIDLIKEKRALLDISTRLTRGHLDGNISIGGNLTEKLLKNLNIISDNYTEKPTHKYVTVLDKLDLPKPTDKGYKNFSRVFYVSSLNNDGVDDIRNYLKENAKMVDTWNHNEDTITDLKTKEFVHESIRGRIMNNLEKELPYIVDYHYDRCNFDDNDCITIWLKLICKNEYDCSKVIGSHGVNLRRIVDESRKIISNNLGCDVVLDIVVMTRKLFALREKEHLEFNDLKKKSFQELAR